MGSGGGACCAFDLFGQLLDDNPGNGVPSRGSVTFGVVGAGAHPHGHVHQACFHPLAQPFNWRGEKHLRDHCPHTRDGVEQPQTGNPGLKGSTSIVLKSHFNRLLMEKKAPSEES